MSGRRVTNMVVMTVVSGILSVLLLVSVAVSYLIYVRIKDLQSEVDRLRAKMEVEEEELENIESSLKSLEM